MAERRYSDAEIAAIFRAAAELPEPVDPQEDPGTGLTLAQLQAIGREVGLPPEAIARAARTLDIPPVRAKTFLGLPLGVTHTVPLHRRVSDAEWERLVVQLRDVFDARGRLWAAGSIREWTNGNLQVLLEPAEDGHQLRFKTVHGGAQAALMGGLVLMGMAAALTVSSAIAGALDQATTEIAVLALSGLVMIANRAWRLPRWARTRAQQMVTLGLRLALPAPSSLPSSPPAAPGNSAV
jgi:hypothetical protein